MEAGAVPTPDSGINAPHPDDRDPSAFFDDLPEASEEPTLEEGAAFGRALPDIPGLGDEEPPVDGSLDPAQVAADLSASRERAAAALAETPEPRPAPIAPREPAPQEPAAVVDLTLDEFGFAAPTPPPAPARAPRGTTEPPRHYAVLREVALSPEILRELLRAAEADPDGDVMTAYVMLEADAPGRAPKQVGKDAFKRHYKRLGVGLQGQAPLVLFAVAHSTWQRMVLSIKPRVIDDNIEIEGEE